MGMIRLRDPVYEERLVSKMIKPALVADKCDSCGKVFEMREFCNEEGRARLKGTFDRSAVDEATGKGLGNIFWATVCSFQCAHRVFNGGWRDIEGWTAYVKADACLARAEVCITSRVDDEAALIKRWSSDSGSGGSDV